ncbi:MAG: hypothetical protein COU08_04460 [Candidatus Harrisonbacteria bacterium CG10_big_fil_rev_8_21_14_0_10_42_17]|uniref:Peptidase M14 domain-containing protein n=1 Tax=Candidatus Harrisonbacteria bacterium CG10_big_fil_rev_8_21_14_0_10_42_17 TaxID=1974584 RepID=A0A2M6WH11_9BACT|nr:MAG: hypothetical protein COU08_04460 [Candidatus Harrisonbacteria bacterium CG10_big_fil_rev_8_21_14_0_10_42_17]
MNIKKIILTLLILILIGGGLYFFFTRNKETAPVSNDTTDTTEVTKPEDVMEQKPYTVIGQSVEQRPIEAYRFGTGEKTIVYVGAMHGGYEWNSALLSYDLIDYLTANPTRIPENVSVVVIPVANPDGLARVVGTSERFEATDAPQFNFADEVSIDDPVVAGRFNAHKVDLNRNFACKWQPRAVWRSYDVNAGTAAFSEPESAALRDFFLAENPVGVIFFHSASNGVYTSFCGDDPLPGTVQLLDAYSKASGYTRYDDYPYYEVTGDAADWLSTEGIPAITIELATHTAVEWDKNLKGFEAVLKLYSK